MTHWASRFLPTAATCDPAPPGGWPSGARWGLHWPLTCPQTTLQTKVSFQIQPIWNHSHSFWASSLASKYLLVVVAWLGKDNNLTQHSVKLSVYQIRWIQMPFVLNAVLQELWRRGETEGGSVLWHAGPASPETLPLPGCLFQAPKSCLLQHSAMSGVVHILLGTGKRVHQELCNCLS